MVFAEKKTAAAATTYKADDPVAKLIATAEGNLISTTPGAVPPHLDDGGHLPFGGIDGGTRGRSAFGKRKMTRENAIGNPQALQKKGSVQLLPDGSYEISGNDVPPEMQQQLEAVRLSFARKKKIFQRILIMH